MGIEQPILSFTPAFEWFTPQNWMTNRKLGHDYVLFRMWWSLLEIRPSNCAVKTGTDWVHFFSHVVDIIALELLIFWKNVYKSTSFRHQLPALFCKINCGNTYLFMHVCQNLFIIKIIYNINTYLIKGLFILLIFRSPKLSIKLSI